MRTWSYEDGCLMIDGKDAAFFDWAVGFELDGPNLARFIVDACNAAEERQAILARIAADKYGVSPRGHAVMEDS